jgi:cell division transport system permease protein
MTISVVMTMWISLSLFGASLLIMQQVDLAKGAWYDKIEISVFMCTAYTNEDGDVPNSNCEPGIAVTDEQQKLIKDRLETNPESKEVFYQSQHEAYLDFQKQYHNSPMVTWMSEDMINSVYHVKLVNPESYLGIIEEAKTLPGVANVQDLHSVLDPLFRIMNGIRWATMAMAAVLLLAAALQIGNTIRLSAFNRRREIGIMRLVGASSTYITLPFLLESLVSGIMGILATSATLAAVVRIFIIPRSNPGPNSQLSPDTFAWIGWPETGVAILGVTVVGILLAVIPTLIATRKYLRV